jgi:hypothetical protein
VKIHILSDRRLPFSSSPLAAVPLLPRSGFVQSAASIASNDPKAGPDLTGHGGWGRPGPRSLGRASVGYTRLRGGLLIQINPREAWEARGGV